MLLQQNSKQGTIILSLNKFKLYVKIAKTFYKTVYHVISTCAWEQYSPVQNVFLVNMMGKIANAIELLALGCKLKFMYSILLHIV